MVSIQKMMNLEDDVLTIHAAIVDGSDGIVGLDFSNEVRTNQLDVVVAAVTGYDVWDLPLGAVLRCESHEDEL